MSRYDKLSVLMTYTVYLTRLPMHVSFVINKLLINIARWRNPWKNKLDPHPKEALNIVFLKF